ncbi:hypothetical protein N0V93_005122 [Gnomoniopsis smithogilvyi]|uniref:DUF7730 domain-containing protein n=1 Tax=Gnomoniopsis smithogilvyi TaxID=1191159 RepID=A0A9W9CXS6_9PEZI|nr:hypothetical protein N0V93_005122 [Gnomoniopsis smithogilvyi]
MSSPSDPGRRYPKRQRTAVTYSETANSQDELDQDSETVDQANATSPAAKDQVSASDDDDDDDDDDDEWTLQPNQKKHTEKPKVKKHRIKEPKPFPFMNLVPELREAVYKLVVGTPDSVISIQSTTLTNWRLRRNIYEVYRPHPDRWVHFSDHARFRNLGLLRVSKGIYEEAAVVLYTKHKFVFLRLTALQTFLLLMRPQTLSRLIHVHIHVSDSEWNFMPGVASQLLQLRYLQTLKIFGLGCTTSNRNFAKYLIATGRPMSTWPTTVESFDKLKGIQLARDIYPFMFPFLNAVIRAGPIVAKDPQPDGSSKSEPELASSDGSQSSMTKYIDPTSARALVAHTEEEQDSPYQQLAGINALVQALELDESWHTYAAWYSFDHNSSPFSQFVGTPMTDTRRSTKRTAMKEELLTLMGKDSF